MDEFITISHSFKAGDLLSILPSVKNICKKEGKKAIIYQEIGLPGIGDERVVEENPNSFTEKMFELMKPLLMFQSYIHDFRIWKGEEVRYNMNLTRMNNQMPIPGGNIFYWPMMMFTKLEPDLSEPWLESYFNFLSLDYFEGRTIAINRTERYQSPYMNYFFLKEYESKCVFVGTQKERDLFCKRWSVDIPCYHAVDFIELYSFLMSRKLVIANQSMVSHLVLGGSEMPRMLLEISPSYPNVWPVNEHTKPFILEPQAKVLFENAVKDLNL